MNVGELDRRILIQQKTVTQDAVYGTEVIAWATLASVWANVQDALPSRSESILSGSIEVSNLPTRIRIRWRRDVDSSMRIIVTQPKARTLQIISGPADIGGRRNYIEMMCEEISTQ